MTKIYIVYQSSSTMYSIILPLYNKNERISNSNHELSWKSML